jgi:DNA-binding CsgD family transcriptional regulator
MVGPVDDEVQHARGVLRLVAELTRWDGVPGPWQRLGPRETEAALDAAHGVVLDRLVDPSVPPADRGRLAALLVRIGQARTAVREAGIARRGSALADMQVALDHLRAATTVADLIERAPTEAGRIGYDRCLFSQVQGGTWVARSSYVRGDPALAAAMTEAGSRVPRVLDGRLIESEILRRRASILVTDPQRNPRVHPELGAVTGTTSYVAAPVIVGRAVLGFVHADSSASGRAMDESDRDLLAMLGECVGLAFERAIYHERLQAIKATAMQYSSSVIDTVDEMVEDNVDPQPPRTGPCTEIDGRDGLLTFASRPPRAACLDQLTVREREVLECMAEGDTNARIARRLFVAEATVKAHVKHILRKLGAANRAAAVSRYLRRD